MTNILVPLIALAVIFVLLALASDYFHDKDRY